MSHSRFAGTEYLLLLLAIFLTGIIVGCDAFSTANDRPLRDPPPVETTDTTKIDIPNLNLFAEKKICFSDSTEGGIIRGKVTNGLIDSIATRYVVLDSIGNEVAAGVVPEDSTFEEPVNFDGTFDVRLQDTVGDSSRTAKDTVLFNCFERPVGPGNFRRISQNCPLADNGWDFQGQFTVEATRGWERILLINVTEQDTLVDETSEPVPGETRTFSNLDDARYKSVAINGESPDFVEWVASCDEGPGDITLNKQCNTDTGNASFSLNIERGVQSFSIDRDGQTFEVGSGITPEFDQTLPLEGDQYSDAPNGDYTGDFERSGISTSKEWSIDCQEDLTPPNAKFDFTTDDLKVDFDASDSNDPDGSIVSYDWEFGDGITGTSVTPSHTYDEPGTYTVTLTVEDNDGLTGDAQKDLTVEEPQPPTAVAKVDSTSELTAYFNGSDSSDPDGQIVSYQWDFGDGHSGSGVKPSHEYNSPGTYTGTLTVTDNDGSTDSDGVTVTVDAQPKICGCVYNIPASEMYIVDSKRKFLRKFFFRDNLVPVDPYSDWVKFRVDARFGGSFAGNPQPNEGFGLGLLPTTQSDTIYTDVASDPYDGIPEEWIFQDITVDANQIPVDTEISVSAVHQNDPSYGHPGNDGFNSVVFKDPGDGSDRGSHVEVLFEVRPGNDCPSRYTSRTQKYLRR